MSENLTDAEMLAVVQASLEKRKKYPAGMGFHPLRWHDSTKLKTPWLEGYLDLRRKLSDKNELFEYLRDAGADSSALADRSRGQ